MKLGLAIIIFSLLVLVVHAEVNSRQVNNSECEGYRGFTTDEINQILLPKSIHWISTQLDKINKKLSKIRDLLPTISQNNADLSRLAEESWNFYENGLLSLCSISEQFEQSVGCDEPCGSETRCIEGDLCINNECVGGTPADCSQDFGDDACVTSWCDEVLGCMHEVKECEDDDPCTISYCEEGVCFHKKMNCGDNDGCTRDECVEGVCVHTPICEDHNPCTLESCDKDCSCGTCTYEFVPECFASEGQNTDTNPTPSVLPRPRGNPLILNGAQSEPPVKTDSFGEAFFWVRAGCQLIYSVTIHQVEWPNAEEEGTHIVSEGAVVHTLPEGKQKDGIWNFCADGMNATSILEGNLSIVSKLNTGDITTQIRFEV